MTINLSIVETIGKAPVVYYATGTNDNQMVQSIVDQKLNNNVDNCNKIAQFEHEGRPLLDIFEEIISIGPKDKPPLKKLKEVMMPEYKGRYFHYNMNFLPGTHVKPPSALQGHLGFYRTSHPDLPNIQVKGHYGNSYIQRGSFSNPSALMNHIMQVLGNPDFVMIGKR